MIRAALKLAAALGATGLLSGCVAAVVPLAAGAVLVKTQSGCKTLLSPDQSAATAEARSDLKVVLTSLTALPMPDAAAAPGNPSISAFRSYALNQVEMQTGTAKRTSAIVPHASELRAARSNCGALPAAVFVDLDPGRGTFDPLMPGDADPALGAALATLRQRGIRVVWFSRLSANFAGAVRAALAQGGLDPAGSDELVLMRDLAERKQSRRDEAAKRLCPIAMLGDERADFDELYLYLKTPDAAVGLDAMIGNGWFLASPFALDAPASGTTP